MISTRACLRAATIVAATGILLAGGGMPSAGAETSPQIAGLAAPHGLTARIVPTKRPLQCVPFARKASGIQIRGDAWTWWAQAKGRYERGRTPKVGAVLAMKKTNRLRLGHLAVVTRIVNDRVIVVDQANWLNQGRIHLNTAVIDVSRDNDWSAVRVWYTPGDRYGARTYAAHGFIYPDAAAIRVAGLSDGLPLPPPPKPDIGTVSLPDDPGSRAEPSAPEPDRPPPRKPARVQRANPPAHEVMQREWRRG